VPVDDDTQRLLVRWRSGNRDAGNLLLRRYVPELTGFFGRRASGNADELVQRTLLACTQNVGDFQGRSTFRTYLFGIARNQYVMYQRGQTYAEREPVAVAAPLDEGPSQLAAVRQEHVLLILALRLVERDFSVVLRKYYWEERSIDEIAAELGIPRGTVKSRLSRGRAALRANVAKVKVREEVRREALRELSSWLGSRKT
jgi:RNA polymerase sigma factor (sigma-70 family)